MKKINIRKIVQGFFFLLIALVAVNHSLAESGKSIPFIGDASAHGICPFGGVVTLYQLISTGTFIKKIHASAVVLSTLVITLAVFFGPVFCGWVCPFGTFQEWLAKLGKKVNKKHNAILPRSLDSVLRYFRYVVLVMVLYMTAKTATLMFASYDPYNALFQFWTGEVEIGAFIVLGVVILLSFFVERPFCKYACPYGALLGITNLFRVFGIKRHASTCINCKKCDRTCPMNIEVSTSSVVRNHQCISCLQCTSEAACPIQDTVQLQVGKGKGEAHESI